MINVDEFADPTISNTAAERTDAMEALLRGELLQAECKIYSIIKRNSNEKDKHNKRERHISGH